MKPSFLIFLMRNPEKITTHPHHITFHEAFPLPNLFSHCLFICSCANQQVKRSWFRNLLMHGFNFLVSRVAVQGIQDTQCGFKLFSRRAAQEVSHLTFFRPAVVDVTI